jgi:hypothetical protein
MLGFDSAADGGKSASQKVPQHFVEQYINRSEIGTF